VLWLHDDVENVLAGPALETKVREVGVVVDEFGDLVERHAAMTQVQLAQVAQRSRQDVPRQLACHFHGLVEIEYRQPGA